MAEIDEAEKAWPHSSSVIAFTLRVDTPWTYISASVATKARSERLVALEQLGGEAPGPVLRNPQLELADPRHKGTAVIARAIAKPSGVRSPFEAPSASSISASSTSCITAGGLNFSLGHGGVPSRESVT